LRPQHILDALLVPGADSANEQYFLNQEREDAHVYYVLNMVARQTGDRLALLRRVWFDGSSLELVRAEYYDAQGAVVEDVRYSGYQDYQGVRFASYIQLDRPVDDYSLGMIVQQATFNQPILAERFVLNKPANAEEIRVGIGSGEGGQGGQ
jgi:hypothetical protein